MIPKVHENICTQTVAISTNRHPKTRIGDQFQNVVMTRQEAEIVYEQLGIVLNLSPQEAKQV